MVISRRFGFSAKNLSVVSYQLTHCGGYLSCYCDTVPSLTDNRKRSVPITDNYSQLIVLCCIDYQVIKRFSINVSNP